MADSDVDAVVALAHANIDGVLAGYHSAAVMARFRDEITAESFREWMTWKQVFVAEDQGQVVATGSLADFGTAGEPKQTVSQFYVRPDLHRRGIGSHLLAHLVRLARATGADALHVPSSRHAVPFYQHAGFVADALQPDEASEMTWMTLRLSRKSGSMSVSR